MFPLEAKDHIGDSHPRDLDRVVVDVGGGDHKWAGSGLMPTITYSRGYGSAYYLPGRRQKMSMVELGRFQGLAVFTNKPFHE